MAAPHVGRPHRRAMSRGRALEELRANAGTQFDPQVVAALLEDVGAGAVPSLT